MALIDTLVLDTRLDSTGFRRGFADIGRMRSAFAKDGPLAVGGQATAQLPAPEVGPVALPNIAGDFKKALAPLAGLMGKQAAVFEKMAGSILATNRRLDADLKFDQFQSTVTRLRTRVMRDFDEMSEKGQKRAKALDAAFGVAQGFSKFKNNLETMIGLDRKAAGEIDRIRPKLISFGSIGAAAAGGVAGAVEKTHLSFKALAVGIGLTLGPAVLIAKAFAFLKSGVSAASNLNESVSKTRAIFQDASGSVETFADGLASKFGIVKQETLDVASGFGGLFKGLGNESGNVLAKSTADMTKMAADLSSYANISFGEAGQALRTALSGETSDVLKGLGVITTDNAVSAYAYANGIGKIGTELTDTQKMAARTRLIYEGLADAQGDIDKTGGNNAGQLRALTGGMTNLAASVGTALMPAVDAGLSVLNALVGTLASGFESSKDGISGVVETVASNLRWVAILIEQPKVAFEVLRLKAEEAFLNIGGWADATFTNFALRADYAGRVATSFFGDLAHNGLAAIQNLGSNFAKLGSALLDFLSDPMGGFKFDGAFTPLTDGFRQTIEALPNMVAPVVADMSAEIARASRPLDEAFAKRQKVALDAKGGGAPMGGAGAGGLIPKRAAITAEMSDYIKELRDGIKTPLEKYGEAMAKLKEARKLNLISDEEFKRGEKFNRKEAGFDEVKFAGAQERGSSGAYSTIVSALAGRGNEFANRKQQEIANNGKEANKILGKIADNLSGNRNPLPIASLA